mgnify:CR=1 FL=1
MPRRQSSPKPPIRSTNLGASSLEGVNTAYNSRERGNLARALGGGVALSLPPLSLLPFPLPPPLSPLTRVLFLALSSLAAMPTEAATPSRLGMFVACSAYTLAGPALILLNNHIMHGLHFPHPIMLSAFGVIFSALVCRLLVYTGIVPLTRPELARSGTFLIYNTLPLAVMAALTLGLGNSAYMYLSVATCQILKSLTPGMTLSLTYALKVEEPNGLIIACVLLICVGTAMASSGEFC